MSKDSKVTLSTITINGVDYAPVGSNKVSIAPAVDGMEFCVIRTKNAGVHVGYVSDRSGMEVTLLNSRRLWYWEGAMTLSEVAITGITKPDACKVACVVPKIYLTEVIEIIPCSVDAKYIIDIIKVWVK
jgi:hypothetical protein